MRKKNTDTIKRSYADPIFDVVNVILMAALFIVFTWPLWFVFIASFSDPTLVSSGKVLMLPKGFTLTGYQKAFQSSALIRGYLNTIGYTVVGTILNLVMTVCCAYPISRRDFLPGKFLTKAFMFTMYFGGGLIPTYLLVKQLGLVDTRLAMIIPGVISVYNVLIVRTYFMTSIPMELQEAATLDGANTAQYLWKVVLPLSKPVLAVVGLYYAVGHWNDFYTALIYIYDHDLYPLQSILRELLMVNQTAISDTSNQESVMAAIEAAMTMKYGVIVLSCVPMLCVYPFVQKFFVKGMMIGSVKG